MASPARIAWVDYARGVGIVLVVLGHTLRGLEASGVVADGPAFHAADAWIYAFHMPLFFLLSGLFAGRRAGLTAGPFLRDKLTTIAYPYFVWSTIQVLVMVAVGGRTNHKASPADLAGILVYPVVQFWFLYVLFLISLIYYALRRIGLGPVGAAAGMFVLWLSAPWVPVGRWWPLSLARLNGVYYGLGSVVNERGGTERLHRAPAPALVAAVVAGYAVVTASVVRPFGGSMPVTLVVALCGIAASLALAVLLSRARGLDFVRTLGAYSLEIYVAHTIASAGLRIVLQKALKVHDPAVHVVVGTLGGLLLPLALVWLARRFRAGFLFRFPNPGKGSRPRPA